MTALQHLVLIGASAGGLDPLRELLGASPRRDDMAFVVAQHLAGSDALLLPQLLQTGSALTIRPAQNGDPLTGGTVFVCPPGTDVRISEGRLVFDATGDGRARPSIDLLFTSAAQALGPQCIGIVLSGSGRDGAIGARHLRDAGGVVWAQSPSTASFTSMPGAVIDGGLADWIAAPADMGKRLHQTGSRRAGSSGRAKASSVHSPEEQKAFSTLLRQLSQITGLDLEQYQPATLRRQLGRLMRQENIERLSDLAERAAQDEPLARTLAGSMTIGVTQWLRDPGAFTSLRALLRERLAAPGAPSQAVRAWSCGCSTGEEAYSLAMVIDDLVRELDLGREFIVLGTDVDETALNVARSGVYADTEMDLLPTGWRERYFVREGRTLRVRPELRRRCIFTRHDVMRELPFMRMDVVACRNVLIYLKAESKDAVLTRLHHALQPDGLLMLGASEGLTPGARALFAPVAGESHLFRRRPGKAGMLWLPTEHKALITSPAGVQLRRGDQLEAELRESLFDLLLRRHAPPTVLVDRHGHPLHLVGDVRRYLIWPEGPKTELALPNLVPAAWRKDVRVAMHQLTGTAQREVTLPLLPTDQEAGPPVRLEAVRLDVEGDPFLAFSFVTPRPEVGGAGTAAAPRAGAAVPADDTAEQAVVRLQLEQERHEQLIDALEQSQRDLQQLNDRLLSTGEELEAANEELEASNEELQASNEELRTLNEELDRALREQQQLSDLLGTVQESIQSAVLILDAQSRVLRFNRRCMDWLGLGEGDIGQPWQLSRGNFPWPDAQRLAARLLTEDVGVHQEEFSTGSRHYLLQISPWRTRDARAGSVVTLSDLTPLKQIERERLELQTRLSAMTAALHEAVLLATPGLDELRYVSPRLAEWLGVTAEQLQQDPSRLRAAIVPADRERVLERWRRTDDPQWQQRYGLIDGAGRVRVIQERASHIPTPGDRPALMAASLLDVTEVAQLETRERVAQARMRALWNNPTVGMAICDTAGRVIEANAALSNWLGHDREQLQRRAWSDLTAVDDRAIDQGQWTSVLNGWPTGPIEKRLLTPQNEVHWARQHLVLEHQPAPVGDFVVVIAENIDESKAREHTIFRQANFDTLTGLPNRNLFRDRLQQAMLRATREGHYVFVLFLDLDGFKEVNDLYGHEAGDTLLTETAMRLKHCLRPNDTVARFGGDEFVILIDSAESPGIAERVTSNILVALREPYTVNMAQICLSASIGVSAYPTDSDTVEELLRLADTAMYAAKSQGKDRTRFYSPQMESAARRQSEIKSGLERALANGEFELYFQPVIALPGERPVGAEALLRWNDPQRGMVPPDQFIPIAEVSGQIRRIGAWVLREAARYGREAAERWGGDFRIAVNLSAAQFGGPELEEWLLQHAAALPHLVIEVTESVLMHDSASTWRWLEQLRGGGARIAIDDFGTGYSSLAYLQRLSLDYLKLDKSFTEHVGDGGPSERIVSAVFDIAAAVQAQVIVEGLETEQQLRFFSPLAPVHIQGYHYAKPLPWDGLVAYMAQRMPSAVGHAG